MTETQTFSKPLDPVVAETPDSRWTRLRGYNVVMGTLHLLQGLAVVALANDFSLPSKSTMASEGGAPGSVPGGR